MEEQSKFYVTLKMNEACPSKCQAMASYGKRFNNGSCYDVQNVSISLSPGDTTTFTVGAAIEADCFSFIGCGFSE